MTAALETSPARAVQVLEDCRAELLGFLTAMVGHGRAEDILQDVYLRFSACLAHEEIRNPRAYVFRIAANLARDALRSEKRHRELEAQNLVGDQEPAASAGDQALLDEQLRLLQEIVDTLPPRCRRIFLLKRVEERSYAEIAALEGITEKTVENQVGRALKLIRERGRRLLQ